MTKIINFFGGPGIGKSGIAAGVYAEMKAAGLNVEMVTEVAKDYVWEERFNVLTSDQLIIYAKQHRRLDRLRGRVDYVITDCPLLMCIAYIPPNSYDLLEPLIVQSATTFDNFNVILRRADGTHKDEGRYHNEQESKEKDKEIWRLLDKYDPDYIVMPVDQNTVESTYNIIRGLETLDDQPSPQDQE